jgi:DNA-binding transcriptional MerR regulator
VATDAIDRPDARTRGAKSPSAFRTISEVSTELEVPQHVLRFWESKFSQLRPLKRGGGRRYYRPEDVELIRRIHTLLYQEGYTIKGVQRLLRGRKGRRRRPAGARTGRRAEFVRRVGRRTARDPRSAARLGAGNAESSRVRRAGTRLSVIRPYAPRHSKDGL